jgi:hypothetical protein
VHPIVFAVLGSLLIVVGMVVPIPYGPAYPKRASRAPTISAARCYGLTYSDPTQPLPSFIELRLGRARIGYEAMAGGAHEFFLPEIEWFPIGPDSVEIRWHHSPSLRLPMIGDSVVGRVVPTGTTPPILLAVDPPKELAIRAIRTPCIPPPAS